MIGILSDGTAMKQEATGREQESGMKGKLMRGSKLNYKHGRGKGMQPKITITQTIPTIHLHSEPVSIELYERFGNTIPIKYTKPKAAMRKKNQSGTN